MSYLGGHVLNEDALSVSSVSYPNGIEHQGIASGNCFICREDVGEVKLTPIIVAKGYSICTYNQKAAFSNGYEVYHEALSVYESVYGQCEIGIAFLLRDRYENGLEENPNLDIRKDIDQVDVHYVQDNDVLCIQADTEDGKFHTVSYLSIYGMIKSQGLL